jgi:serine protease Do
MAFDYIERPLCSATFVVAPNKFEFASQNERNNILLIFYLRNIKMALHTVSMLIMFVSLYAIKSHAEIYSYKDEQGKMHFTDVNPGEVKSVVLLDMENAQVTSKSSKKKADHDLLVYLTDLIKPSNEIDKATLAVVKIETPTGSGSGFFVSEQGHIITNKHVVRITETKYWKSKQQEMESAEQKVEEAREYLQQKNRNENL